MGCSNSYTSVYVLLFQFSSVTQSCPTLCDPMDCSMPGLPVYHQLLESTQTHVHCVGDAIQQSHPLSFPFFSCPQSFPASESESEVAQSCLTLWDPMDCSRPGSSVHGIFQAWILERVAFPFSRGSFQPRDQTQVFCITGRFFYQLSYQGSPCSPWGDKETRLSD